MIVKVAALLWLPVVCLGEAPRASLLQLGSLSKRGATLTSVGEARGFSSTLAGFQKYTDQLVDTYMKDGVAPTDAMKETIALIVNYINIDMFNALVLLHHADLELISECAPCDESASPSELLLGREGVDGQVIGSVHDHKCARQRLCGMASWGTDGACTQTHNWQAYQNLQSGDTHSCEGWEQELWRLRDATAVLRKRHKDCVIENTQHDQKNDLSCRQYNKYRGAWSPETYDPRSTVEASVTVMEKAETASDYQDGSPRNIYEEVVLDGVPSKFMDDDDLESHLKTKYLQVSLCARRTHTTDDHLEGTSQGVQVGEHVHVNMKGSDPIGTSGVETADRPDGGHRLGRLTLISGAQCEVLFPQGETLTSDYSTRPRDQFTDLHGSDNKWTGPCSKLVKATSGTPTRGRMESVHDEYDHSIFWTQCCQNEWKTPDECNTLGKNEACKATMCPHQNSEFSLTHTPPPHYHGSDREGESKTCGRSADANKPCEVEWSAACSHVDNLGLSMQIGDGKQFERYLSMYPECGTPWGSAWKKIVQPVDCDATPEAYRVDGRKYTDWGEGDLSKQMVMAEDVEARMIMEVCLEAVNHWFQPLYHYYVQCSHNDFHTHHEACKPDQNKYEEQACSWRETEDKFCDDYKECIETEGIACKEGEFCQSLETKVQARKADYETGQRIICLLAVLISDDDTEAGRDGDVTDEATGFHYTDADGNRVKRNEAVIYASKKERLDECKAKKNNDDGPDKPHSRGNADKACIPRKESAFVEGDYTLVTKWAYRQLKSDGIDGACRTASGEPGTMTVAAGVTTDAGCREACSRNSDCVAYEFPTPRGNECEIHTEPIAKVAKSNGVFCYVKDGHADHVVDKDTLDKDLDSQQNAIDAWEYNHEQNVDRPDQVRVFKVADATCPENYEPVTTRYECALAGDAMTGAEVESDEVRFVGNPDLGTAGGPPNPQKIATASDFGDMSVLSNADDWKNLPACFRAAGGLFYRQGYRTHSVSETDEMFAVGTNAATRAVPTMAADKMTVCIEKIHQERTADYDAQEKWQDPSKSKETLRVAEWMSRGACQIDTEQWELEQCGGGEAPDLTYPKTFCVPSCESRSDGENCVQSPVLIDEGYDKPLTYGDGASLPGRIPMVPTYYVGPHHTETDHFSVPCSADFFLDQQWGYIQAAACPAPPEANGADTCAGPAFEPAKSLNAEGRKYTEEDKAGGLMLHMKMFPRPAIMRSPGRSDHLAETSVLCLDSTHMVSFQDDDGCKVILVHESYFKGSVWEPVGGPTFAEFHYGGDGETLNFEEGALHSNGPTAEAAPYQEVHGISQISSHADAFDIYGGLASKARETYTAYPDHFSYEWCIKCEETGLKMALESGTWTWRNPQPGAEAGTSVRKLVWKTDGETCDQPWNPAKGTCDDPTTSTVEECGETRTKVLYTPCWNFEEFPTRVANAYGASFGGNCEGATWTQPVAAAGETVPGFRQQDSSFQETVPAYHPKSCQGSVWMGSPTDDGSGGSRVAE